ncbi:hypothetical protein GALMADRAFT_214047 [Galerina marginata CBS 339.88]|uniref:Uncharacterized protein n=1 Tax=Galerina marginata (strain CBS 339.88) TaxID=685588 RepID=A0A067STK9_GALM3|nr:hypothetical protein GALMADRAFT_214047 [Galerina marginata CBS 339.88]
MSREFSLSLWILAVNVVNAYQPLLNHPTPFAKFILARTEDGNGLPEAIYQQHLYPDPSIHASPPRSGPPLQPHATSFVPLKTPPKTAALELLLSSAIEADIDVDDAALEEEYDAQISGEDRVVIPMAQKVFGTVDIGGSSSWTKTERMEGLWT